MPLLPSEALRITHGQLWPSRELSPSSPSQCPPALVEDRDGLSTDDEDLDSAPRPENPLKYFLTPAALENEELEFEFDFDAGIEDSNSPRQKIRSVSPSTLDGLRRYQSKRKDSSCAILDDDEDDDEDNGDDSDDGEDYIRFSSQKPFPFGLDRYFDRPRHSPPQNSTTSRTADALLSPSSFHVGSPNGGLARRLAPLPRRPVRGRTTHSLRRRHSWREPSPDVWAIEEEPEKETMSEMGLSMVGLDEADFEEEARKKKQKTRPIDIPTTKPGKKVRFVLPVKEF
ncbi:hypothetical protein GGR50DRAFT_263975 [Xylaria sp. CBS 124048]|nr:hypothetical protein GGR50DRAFT_263975 [Xylaria sp. CBS 124048]